MEVWKYIVGYEGFYKISNTGKVKSYHRDSPILLSQGIEASGYYSVNLSKNGNQKSFRVHRLVSEYFISNKSPTNQVNHKDGNKLNNIVDNLEWVTCSENIKHSHDNGLTSKNRKKRTKLQKKDVLEIRASILSMSRLSDIYNTSLSNISHIKNRISWRNV